VSSYLTISPLLPPTYSQRGRFLFCGTFLPVTGTGHYPAPCPVEPGLSSPLPERQGGDHSSCSDIHLTLNIDILKTFIFAPIDNAHAMRTTHQLFPSNKLIELLWRNAHMTPLTHTLNNRIDSKTSPVIPK